MSVISAPIVTHTSQRPTVIRPIFPSYTSQKPSRQIQTRMVSPPNIPPTAHETPRLLTRPSDSQSYRSQYAQPSRPQFIIMTKDDQHVPVPPVMGSRSTKQTRFIPPAMEVDRSKALPPSPPVRIPERFASTTIVTSGFDDSSLIWPPTPPDEDPLQDKSVPPTNHFTKNLPTPPLIMSPADELFGFNQDWTAKPGNGQARSLTITSDVQQNVQQNALTERDPNISMTHRRDPPSTQSPEKWDGEDTISTAFDPRVPCDGSFAQRLRSKARSVVKRPVAAARFADDRTQQRSGSATEGDIRAGVKAISSKPRTLSLDDGLDYELMSEEDDPWF